MPITQRGSVLTAADAAASDFFGASVALSSDGLILVVGALFWEGSPSNQGGVYVYDWSGSAWVARGSVLVAADAASGDEYGSGVSLSDDGAILVVGAPSWEGAISNQGGVYVFDWSGSAWTARGSVLEAGDATNSGENFGHSVCLSADGAILAVGSPGQWTNSGRVYIYDWSGSAWVQRGSKLQAADLVNFDRYGSSVALSGDGAILVVGAEQRDGYRGGVYVYDWSGSAWVARGSVLLAADAGTNDYFGSSLSLSSAGTTLAVGAKGWTGSAGSQGAVYLYDWVTSAWVARGAVLEAPDPASADRYGSGVALDNAGTVLAVGASGWEGGASDQGGVYVYDVAADNFSEAYTTLTVELAQGYSEAFTTLTVESRSYAYTTLTVVNPSGISEAFTTLTVIGSGYSEAFTTLALIDSTDQTNWTARCLIDGVDVSDRLEAAITVTADEGAARIATLSLNPTSGTIAPLDYVGKAITLDYVPVIAGVEVPLRLFTGRIDTPRYDLDARLLDLTCVDDLQNRVAALDRSVLDGLIGGRYSAAVQGDITDNWDYAQALLSTVAASLDAGPSGGMRVTPWEIAATWATYDDAQLLYRRSLIEYPQRSTLINHVDIEFDYRYPRLRQRYTTIGWSGTLIDMAPCGYQYPTQQDILGAAGGSGWEVTLGVFWPAPEAIPHSSGGFIRPTEGSIDMAVLYLAQRHSQTVTETYTLPVSAPESVAANGTLPFALRGALESTFDGGAWESALDVAPLMPTGGEQDYAPDAPRADADHAIQTLLDQAKVKIWGSHRGARVTNAVLCNPSLDLDKRVAIATDDMAVAGKVVSVMHTLDLAAGSALTEFTVACFGVGGAGIITPDTLEPPAAPAAAFETQDWPAEVPPLFVHTYGVTPYSDGLMGLMLNPPETIYVEDIPGTGSTSVANPFYVAGTYPVEGFRVQMPGVDDGDRNPLAKPVSSSYQILIPSDPLTFTVP